MTKFDRNKANYCYSDPVLYPILKEHAKRMKEYPTDAERLLWLHLQKSKLGLPFRRQHIIADNIADFACLPAHLVIEIDGGYHDDIRQQYHDQARTNETEKLGFNVIRFTNEDIFERLEYVIETIKTIIS